MTEIVTLIEEERPENVLVVVAHPDDETLGAGATMHRLARNGVGVHVCILSGDVSARAHRPEADELRSDTLKALRRLGVSTVAFGVFPNIQMNTVPHLQLVQFIESAITRVAPSAVFTHHPADVNDDHRQVASACQAAARLPQRQPGSARIREVIHMEVLSSTEWAYGENLFQPTMFQEVQPEDITAKLEALAEYRDVMRPHPHPRSEESVRALAVVRGSQCGVPCAEAFNNVFSLRQGVHQWL